jgi:hypothetical protein
MVNPPNGQLHHGDARGDSPVIRQKAGCQQYKEMPSPKRDTKNLLPSRKANCQFCQQNGWQRVAGYTPKPGFSG